MQEQPRVLVCAQSFILSACYVFISEKRRTEMGRLSAHVSLRTEGSALQASGYVLIWRRRVEKSHNQTIPSCFFSISL